MGILGILTIIFVLLKIFDVISWSWWLVFLPLIIEVGIYVIIFAMQGALMFKVKREFDKTFDDDFFK